MHADTRPDDLDALIDDAARQMTAGTPPARFHERVAGALGPRRRFELHGWQLAAAASLVVLAAAGALHQIAPWGEAERPFDAPVTRAADIPIPAAPPAASTAAPITEPSGRQPALRAAGLAPAAAPIVVEPLALSPLFEPAEAAVIAVDSLPAPMPLALEPLAIEPLTLE